MNRFRFIFTQISVICTFVCIIAGILDWYNPYMNVSGTMWYIRVCLYISVVAAALGVKADE